MTNHRIDKRALSGGTRNSRRSRTLVATILVGLALAGCGGSDDDDATPPSIGGPSVSSGPERTDPDGTRAPTSDAATTVPATGPTTPASTIHEVPVDSLEVLPPIDFDEAGDFGTGVTAEIIGLEAVDGEARSSR